MPSAYHKELTHSLAAGSPEILELAPTGIATNLDPPNTPYHPKWAECAEKMPFSTENVFPDSLCLSREEKEELQKNHPKFNDEYFANDDKEELLIHLTASKSDEVSEDQTFHP